MGSLFLVLHQYLFFCLFVFLALNRKTVSSRVASMTLTLMSGVMQALMSQALVQMHHPGIWLMEKWFWGFTLATTPPPEVKVIYGANLQEPREHPCGRKRGQGRIWGSGTNKSMWNLAWKLWPSPRSCCHSGILQEAAQDRNPHLRPFHLFPWAFEFLWLKDLLLKFPHPHVPMFLSLNSLTTLSFIKMICSEPVLWAHPYSLWVKCIYSFKMLCPPS